MQQRSIPMCVILSIITCGIYGIYWYVKITDETNSLLGKPDTTGVTCFLLTIVTCGIYGLFWGYKMGEKMEALRAGRNEPAGNLPILYLILNLIGFQIITEALIQSDLNKSLSA